MRVLRKAFQISWPDLFNASALAEVQPDLPYTDKLYATGRVNVCPEKDPTKFDCTAIIHCGDRCLKKLNRYAWRTAIGSEREGLLLPNTSTAVDGIAFVHAHKKSIAREGATQPSARFMAGRTWTDIQRGVFRADLSGGLRNQVFELERLQRKNTCSNAFESESSKHNRCFQYIDAIARLECDSLKTPWCHSRG